MTAPDPAAREARPDRRTRIVQIECFYAKFLDDFYRAHAGLAQRPFADQIDALLDSGRRRLARQHRRRAHRVEPDRPGVVRHPPHP